jgi:hypothetical protein
MPCRLDVTGVRFEVACLLVASVVNMKIIHVEMMVDALPYQRTDSDTAEIQETGTVALSWEFVHQHHVIGGPLLDDSQGLLQHVLPPWARNQVLDPARWTLL